MNLAQIRYFVTAAQLQNLSKAAQSLHLSQPSLSKSIAKLEEEVGTPLFFRRGKRVVLSPSGERFLDSAQVILRELDDALLDLRELSAGAARLSVGICEPDGRLTACLADFSAAHPETELDVNCSIDGADGPDINRYDMLFYPDDSRYAKFRGVPLWEEPYLLVVPAGHPLASRVSVLPRELEGLPFVFLSRDRRRFEEPFYLAAGLNLRVRTVCFTDSREHHLQMVASGVALGFVSEGCAGAYREAAGVRVIPVASDRFRRRMMLCFKRDKHLSALGWELRTFVMERFGLEDDQRESTS